MRDLEKMLMDMGKEKNQLKTEPEQLSKEEEQRIIARTLEKIEAEKNSKVVNLQDSKQGRLPGAKLGFWERSFVKVAAAVVAFAVIGGTAGASILHLNSNFKKYFGTTKADKEIITDNVQAFDVSDKQNGITISGQQIIGDATGFYAVFKVKNAPAYVGELQFGSTDVAVPGAQEMGWSDTTMMAQKGKSTEFLLHVMTKDITGKNITVKFHNLGYKNDAGKFVTLKKGDWKLSWNLAYKNNAKTIHINKPVPLYNGQATWEQVKVSPLSVTVYYKIDKNHPVKERFTQKEWEAYDGKDRIVVQFKDGTRLDSRFVSVDDIDENGGDYISICFHKIVDYNNIASISFAGEKLVLLQNYQETQRTRYESKVGNFTMDLSKDLDGVVSMQENAKYKDPDLKTTGTSVTFWGKKGGSKMALFTMFRLKGTYSEKDLEENSPFMNYVGYRGGYTYTIQYGEIQDEGQYKNFTDIMNKDISNVLPYFEYLS